VRALEKARRAAQQIVPDPFRPNYHPAPTTGWMNDPNGLIWLDGKAHLFYQYYPYAPNWGKMHWGHMVSADLVRWEHLPVALAPDQSYERLLGCFSGSAIEHEGKLHLLYTAVSALGGQQQCLAVSENGVDFIKHSKPVIAKKQLPKGSGKFDFRDPKVFKRGDLYYCLVSAAANQNGVRGRQIACYTSDDWIHWRDRGAAYSDFATDKGIFECPDLFTLDGTDVLMMSSMHFYPPQEETRFQNLHPSVYLVGCFDADNFRFLPKGDYQELDGGFDFYAPQVFRMPDGRTILIAWKQMWKRTIPESKFGRAGAMTFPRELSLENGLIVQNPVQELERYHGAATEYSDLLLSEETRLPGVSGNCIDLQLQIDLSQARLFSLRLLKGERHETILSFDTKAGICTFDRTRSGVAITSTEETDVNVRRVRVDLSGTIDVRILIDISSVEVFLNGGKTAMTANVYPDTDDTAITFAAEGMARMRKVRCYPILA
jgi:beta-fructofuranosidase